MSSSIDMPAGARSRRHRAVRRPITQRVAVWGASALVALAVLAAWQILPQVFGIPKYIVPSLGDLATEMRRLALNENLATHVASTFTWAVVGFVLGGLFGALGGYVLGLSPFWEKVLAPYLLGLQIAPKVAFAPLFILWFGYNATPKLLVTVLVVFFPILVNVLQAMRMVDRDQVHLARAYNMSATQVFWKIMFPSSMPGLMAGLRIGATLAVIGITVGELVGGEIGLGYLITYGEGQANSAMVYDAIILLTVVGILMYSAVAFIERRVLHYLPRIGEHR